MRDNAPSNAVVAALSFVASCALLTQPAVAQRNELAAAPMRPHDAAATMKTPRGFQVQMFAAEPDVRQPIGFCLDDRARLWVAEAYNYPKHGDRPGDRIVILEDTDGDGRMDRRKVFYDKLNYVTGIEVGFGGVWVVSPPNFYFIPDKDQDDTPDDEPVVLLDGLGNHANSHNLANGLAWGPDGWLYGTHGRTNWSLLGKPGTAEKDRIRFDGGVYRYHPTRHVWESYADGTTNPWGIDWNDYGEAFVTNCVNPHLFHVIPGAHYEPWRNRKSSEYAFERIATIADHLHFTGLSNVRDGLGSDAEDAAGGGHAHCGTLIYLGENWPARFRNTLLTNNIHGKRVNNDSLRRLHSTYTASHEPDVMLARDPWFVGVTLAAGPAGEVYVSDWSDVGECHYIRNTRKETGRIFRITYGDVVRPRVNLSEATSLDLAALHTSSNEWMVRHARRILQERAAAGDSLDAAIGRLSSILKLETHSIPQRLRAMWTLHALGALPRSQLLSHAGARSSSSDEGEYLRSWAVRLLCESKQLTKQERATLTAVAQHDPSSLVRLHLASSTQRLSPTDAWPILSRLSQHAEDESDKTLSLMIWYGVEPLITDDLQRFATFGAAAKIPLLRRHVARRLAMAGGSALDALVAAMANSDSAEVVDNMIEGALEGLQGRRGLKPPKDWKKLYSHWTSVEAVGTETLEDRLLRLALLFDDDAAMLRLKSLVEAAELPRERRERALQSLIQRRPTDLSDMLLELLSDPQLQATAIRGLATVKDGRTPAAILAVFSSLPPAARQDALQTLASRADWAAEMLTAIENGEIPVQDVTAYTVRSLRELGDQALQARLRKVWGVVRETPDERRKLIATFKRKLNDKVLAKADLSAGKLLFNKQCGTCHKMFGKGGVIGPDLSGAQRSNLDYLLENLLDPSAAVAKAYKMEVMRLDSGRVVTGIVETENDTTIAVFTVNERIVVDKSEVADRKSSSLSIMPDGMLRQMTDAQVRDLMGYLQNAAP